MKKIDLATYNLGELKGLLHDVDLELKNRQQQDLKGARDKILAIAKDAGISVAELLASSNGKPGSRKGQKVKPQYQNPADNSQTWAGRGRQPKWIVEALAKGEKLASFLI